MQCEASAYRLAGEVTTPRLELCERALRIDPRNVRALVRLAAYYGSRVSRVQSADPEADLEQASTLVSRALEIDPGHYAAHCVKATVLEGRRRRSGTTSPTTIPHSRNSISDSGAGCARPECRKGERLNKTLFDDGARKAKTASHLGLAAEVNTTHELDV